jgi:uncharacterized membrane protein YccC
MDGDTKFVCWTYLSGAVVFWLIGIDLVYYSIAYVALVGSLIAGMRYWDSVERQKRKDEEHARRQRLAAMTKEERREFHELENNQRKLELDRREQELSRKASHLAQWEQEITHAINVHNNSQQTSNNEPPLAAKVVTGAVVGYEVGKKIAKW